MRSLKNTHSAPLAVIASEDGDYERFNLAHDGVALWEDGARTDNRRGTYEWWYFDSHLDDGSSLVVVFMNKDLASPNDPLTPTIRIDLDLADGRSYQKLATPARESWQASTSGADVRPARTGSAAIFTPTGSRPRSRRSRSTSPSSARCPPGVPRPATSSSAPDGTRSSRGCHQSPKVP
jgi:hypothetical protein